MAAQCEPETRRTGWCRYLHVLVIVISKVQLASSFMYMSECNISLPVMANKPCGFCQNGLLLLSIIYVIFFSR